MEGGSERGREGGMTYTYSSRYVQLNAFNSNAVDFRLYNVIKR